MRELHSNELKEVVLCDEYNTHLANMIISDLTKIIHHLLN